jgi:hypothetical protein
VTRDPSAEQWISPTVSFVEHRLRCEAPGLDVPDTRPVKGEDLVAVDERTGGTQARPLNP